MSTHNICFCAEIRYQHFLVEKSILSGALCFPLGNCLYITCPGLALFMVEVYHGKSCNLSSADFTYRVVDEQVLNILTRLYIAAKTCLASCRFRHFFFLTHYRLNKLS